jgi:hypothetical protein
MLFDPTQVQIGNFGYPEAVCHEWPSRAGLPPSAPARLSIHLPRQEAAAQTCESLPESNIARVG